MVWFKFLVCSMALLGVILPNTAGAISADFSGGFRFDENYLDDVAQTPTGNIATNFSDHPHEIKGGEGTSTYPSNAHFQTFHLRLIPRLIVNDQTIIYSQWQVGPTWGKAVGSDPNFQFASQYSTTADNDRNQGNNRDYYDFMYGRESLASTRGTDAIQMARAWTEFITDFGTLKLGRMPREWGMGLVWDAGEDIRDRFQSTADTAQLTIKLGNFELSPGMSRLVS